MFTSAVCVDQSRSTKSRTSFGFLILLYPVSTDNVYIMYMYCVFDLLIYTLL